MTRQKSFKNRVRARMDKTSERYSTARRQLLAKSGAEASPGAAVADAPGARRPYSDEVIRRNTGRAWDGWFALLDAWGAARRPHPEIARWLVDEHGVGGWWAQGVTVAYEQARGLREPGQRRGGLYEVSATKTVNVPVERLYEAFADPELRERWLPGRQLRGPHRPPEQVRPGQLEGRLDPAARRLHRPRRGQEPGRRDPRARPRRRHGRQAQGLLAGTGRRPQAGPGGLTGTPGRSSANGGARSANAARSSGATATAT